MAYKRKREVTPQLLSLAHQNHLYVKVTGPMTRNKMEGLARSEDGTVPVLPVINLDTGETALLIVPTVLERILAEVDDPTGLGYELEDRGIREGKNYRDVRVWEIETD